MLSDPYLLEAVKQTNAVVFLDTAARFMVTNDENSAAQNRKLVDDVIALQAAGAVAVILNHHATKASQNEAITLENMVRGTGDFAAMTDMVYGIRKDRATYANGNGPMEIELVSLKDREQIGALTKLRLAASRLADKGPFPTVSSLTRWLTSR
jgi:RecA-family ATPase